MGDTMSYKALAEVLEIIEPPDSSALISLTRQGLPRRTIDNLANALGVSVGEIARLLPVSLRTLQRYQNKQLLDKDLSDHLIQITKVFARAVEVFGTPQNAAQWLKSPILALGSVPPMEMLDTSTGVELVTAILGRIEYGVYS
jgi:putative toxin-antitoxin system antitoxin component (TIGR02293 family)